MSRFKLFIQNFLVYGIGGVISKIIPFIMLPVITRLMPDTFYFGLNDISTVVISFGQALAIMGMYDAMFRMFFEKEDAEYKKDICSSALAFVALSSVVIFVGMLLFQNKLSEWSFGSSEYKNLLVLSAMSILIGSTNSIVAAPTRMNNKRGIFLITNTLSPIISYSISIPLLMRGMYIVALPLAGVISAVTMEITFLILNREWFRLKRVRWDYIKSMLKIALPLVPNFLIYWIFSSCDRLMIAKMLGNDFAGIYAIGGKIGQVSQLIYTAFAGGWQYFAFSTMKDSDQVEMTSKIFEYLGVITFAAGMFMAAVSEPVFNILFTGDYVQGQIVAPYLFVAPLFLMLFQVIGNQFLVIKKTWPNALILSIGAIANIVLNFVLIPIIGIEGAAIATYLGYVIAIIVAVIVLTKMHLVKISSRFLGVTVVYTAFMFLWRGLFVNNCIVSLLLAVVFVVIFVCVYLKDIKKLLNK